MEEYTVYDGTIPVMFTGVLLGRGSSESPHKDRWSETYIYRTEAGSYVVSKIGRTRVPRERDLTSASVCHTPEGVIEQLWQLDDDEVRHMRRVDEVALLEAAKNDYDIDDAMRAGSYIA